MTGLARGGAPRKRGRLWPPGYLEYGEIQRVRLSLPRRPWPGASASPHWSMRSSRSYTEDRDLGNKALARPRGADSCHAAWVRRCPRAASLKARLSRRARSAIATWKRVLEAGAPEGRLQSCPRPSFAATRGRMPLHDLEFDREGNRTGVCPVRWRPWGLTPTVCVTCTVSWQTRWCWHP